MPTVLRVGPYRFFFYSRENDEPAHVHVSRDQKEAKYWTDPLVVLADNYGFASHELTEIRKLVESRRDFFLEKWREYFSAN